MLQKIAKPVVTVGRTRDAESEGRGQLKPKVGGINRPCSEVGVAGICIPRPNEENFSATYFWPIFSQNIVDSHMTICDTKKTAEYFLPMPL